MKPSLSYIAEALQASSSSPINVTADLNANLTAIAGGAWDNVDVLCIDTYTSYTEAQIAGLIKFANTTGKGLMVMGHAWYWGYSYSGNNIFLDLPVNRILWPLGLLVTTDAQDGPAAAPSSPPTTWLYHNSYYLASGLAATVSGGSTASFPFASNFTLAMNALQPLFNFLPSRANSSASGLDGVWAVLDAIGSVRVPIGPANPLNVTAANISSLMGVMMEVLGMKRGDIANLTASPSAPLFPGSVPANAAPVSLNLTINATYQPPPYRYSYAGYPGRLWISTGLYAAPGAIINVTIATAAAIGKGLQVQIGSHSDDLTKKSVWFRVPYTISRYTINSAVTSAGSPLGGSVFIVVPSGSNFSDVQVAITGAIRAPYFRLGVDTVSDWVSTIRNYPAPWAELDSGKFIIMLPSVAIRNYSDPTPVLQHWNAVLDCMADLAYMTRGRARAERFLVDADIGAGWMHSGYPIMAYNTTGVWNSVLNVTYLQTRGAWGPYHELGHNHQWGDMQFSGTVESFVNLFTIYALEGTGVPASAWENQGSVSAAGRANLRASYFAKGANWDADWSVWTALDTFLQLKEGFGWDLYKGMYKLYQNLTYPLPDDNVQSLIQKSSIAAGVNLVPFYKAWNFPITEKTINVTSTLPEWQANPMSPPKPPSPSPAPPPPPSSPPPSPPPSPPASSPPPSPAPSPPASSPPPSPSPSPPAPPSPPSPSPPPPSLPVPPPPPSPPAPALAPTTCTPHDAACLACGRSPNITDPATCGTCVFQMRARASSPNPFLCHECARYGATNAAVQEVCMLECVPQASPKGSPWACSMICANKQNVWDDPQLARECVACVRNTTDGWACGRCIEATSCLADWQQARAQCFECVAAGGLGGRACADCARLPTTAERSACMTCST